MTFTTLLVALIVIEKPLHEWLQEIALGAMIGKVIEIVFVATITALWKNAVRWVVSRLRALIDVVAAIGSHVWFHARFLWMWVGFQLRIGWEEIRSRVGGAVGKCSFAGFLFGMAPTLRSRRRIGGPQGWIPDAAPL